MPTFTVTRGGTTREDAVFDVDPLTDTSNPFGNYCVVKIDDRGGQKFEQYERGTRIDVSLSELSPLIIPAGETETTASGITETFLSIENGGTYENDGTVVASAEATDRFTGYVVERRETEQSGADVLEVEAYSFDQFLRRNTVSNDQTGNLISEALADIIQTDTPVTYNAANISVGDDQKLTRSYRGEPVESVLRDFAFKSNNEDFGVNDALEFFFQPRETTHIDRGIDNSQWFNYDIPELGKEAINEVEVWFNDGDESVIVDDSTDKLDLQDSLNLPSPGTQRAELQRPLITNINDAEDIGRKYLTFRNATLSGTVTTFGLFDAEPGDTIDITIDPRGIDAEFVIAGIEYRWGRDETILTIIEKRGDIDNILTELNESVQRIEMEGANRDAPQNRITTTNATGIVAITTDADGNTPSADRFVNDGRRAVRDAWTGAAPPDIDTLVVGSDGTGLSRSNTDLVNQTNSATVSQALPDTKTVEFSANITQSNVSELGLKAADGTLIMRAVFDAPVSLNGTVTVTLTVSNDASVSRGVLTNDGQTAIRDVLADNTPLVPADYAYGSDNTAVSESDTALGNELVSQSLDEILVQQASTASEWAGITTIATTDPLETENGQLELLQSAFTQPDESATDTGSSNGFISDAKYTSGAAELLSDPAHFVEWTFTVDYTIPESDFEVFVLVESTSGNGFISHEWTLTDPNGNTKEIFSIENTGGSLVYDWIGITGDDLSSNDWARGNITPGTYTIRVQATGSTGNLAVDGVAPLDGRYTYTFDNSNGAKSGPEHYPDQVVTAFDTVSTTRDLTEANFTSVWNDTSGNQYIEIANDGATFTRFNNASTGSTTFASGETQLDTNVALSRFGTQASTPTDGVNGQTMDDWRLFANPDAVVSEDIGQTLTRAVIPPGTITGSTVREAGIKNGSTLLTRHVLAEFTVAAQQRLASSETTRFTSDN